MKDDDGAIQVFEAIIVAVIILTAVLFFTTLQRPSQAADVGGVDLGILASDVLGVLAERNFTDPETPTDPKLELLDWINRTMQGDEEVAETVDAFMRGVLGSATKYELRIDNGVAPLRLLPFGKEQVPLAARGASSFILPFWTAATPSTPPDIVETWPGAQMDCSDWTSLLSPIENNATGPDGADVDSTGDEWLATWQDSCGSGVAAAEQRVPLETPYGIWPMVNATASYSVQVGLPPGTTGASVLANKPVYGLQLLLWRGG